MVSPFNHPSEALVRDLTHDARVAMEDLDLSPEAAAATVVQDSDYVPEELAERYVGDVTARLTEDA